jgi:hypothetical protein
MGLQDIFLLELSDLLKVLELHLRQTCSVRKVSILAPLLALLIDVTHTMTSSSFQQGRIKHVNTKKQNGP